MAHISGCETLTCDDRLPNVSRANCFSDPYELYTHKRRNLKNNMNYLINGLNIVISHTSMHTIIHVYKHTFKDISCGALNSMIIFIKNFYFQAYT